MRDLTATPAPRRRRCPAGRNTPSATGRRRASGLLLAAVLAVSGLAPVVGGAPAAVAASVSGVVNTYQAVSAVTGTTVTVTGATRGAATPFAVGDRVMLIQMTGVSPAQPGSNMGNYDTAVITAVSGSSITLSAITRTYSPATEAVQLVRMEHDTAPTTVTGTITAAPWDGATGGVIAMSGGSLTLNSDIDASETGFTNDNPPTGAVVPSLSAGAGAVAGRNEAGVAHNDLTASDDACAAPSENPEPTPTPTPTPSEPSPSPTPPENPQGELPVTGATVAWTVLGAALMLLLVGGLLVRRRRREADPTV